MPDKKALKVITGQNATDIKQVRLPGLDKPFEKLTISELVQLRPGSEVADSWNVTAVTDNATISSSSVLEELGRIQKIRAMNKVVDQVRLDSIRESIGGIGGRSAAAPSQSVGPNTVALPEDDIFEADGSDPFKAS